MIFKKKKDVAKNVEISANEKVLVILSGSPDIAHWTLEELWNYMKHAYRCGEDPLKLMDIPQNEYALGRAELWGMRNERKDKYGRK